MALDERHTYYMDRANSDDVWHLSEPTTTVFEHYFTKTRQVNASNGLRRFPCEITQKHGPYQCYYENGDLMTSCTFVHDKLDGERIEYWPGHIVRLREVWQNNERVA